MNGMGGGKRVKRGMGGKRKWHNKRGKQGVPKIGIGEEGGKRGDPAPFTSFNGASAPHFAFDVQG